MNPLLSIALFWAALALTMALLGYASIKFGVYTSGENGSKHDLEV